MPNSSITDTWLRRNNGKQTEKEVIKSDGDKLFARLRDGKITFLFRPTLKDGTRIKITLGRYPDMTLKAAREKASNLRNLVSKGIDPRKQISDSLKANVQAKTVDQVFYYWFEHFVSEHRKNTKEIKRAYENHISGKFGSYYFKEITRQMWIEHFMKLKKVAPQMTLKVLTDMRAASQYCIDHDYVNSENTLQLITSKTLTITKKNTKRYLSDAEIAEMYAFIDKKDTFFERNKLILDLLLITGARSGELRHTQVSWLDFNKKTWTIPAEYHKTGYINDKPLIRPIIDEIAPLFKRLIEISSNGQALLTKSDRSGRSLMEPITRNGMEHVTKSFLRMYNDEAKRNKTPLFESFSNHDLRRTARTNWSNYGSWEVCERMMGHKLPGETDVYDQNKYLNQMTRVYKQWFYRLQELKGQTYTSNSNVVSFK